MSKTVSSYALSDEARLMLERLSKKLGISRASVLEVAIREKAIKDNVEGGARDLLARIDKAKP